MACVIEIREVAVDDGHGLDQVALVHALSWRDAYRGLVPDSYLDAIDPTDWAAHYRNRIPDGRTTLLASEAAEPLGMITYGQDRGHQLDGEIYAVYVRPTGQRRGIGRRLVDAALGAIDDGSVVGLWCAAENQGSRRFYEDYGFIASGAESMYETAGISLATVQYSITVRRADG